MIMAVLPTALDNFKDFINSNMYHIGSIIRSSYMKEIPSQWRSFIVGLHLNPKLFNCQNV